MIQQTDKYVNDIKFNGSSINRIYLDGEVYWGNDPAPAPTATYEILESIITPSSAVIDTLYTADENTVVEMTMKMPTNYGNYSHNYRLMSTFDSAPADMNGYWGSTGTWGLQFEDSTKVLGIAQLGRYNSVYKSTIRFSSLSGYKYRYEVTAKGVCTIYDMNNTVVYSFDAGYTSGYTSQTTITFFGLKGVQTPIYDDTVAGNTFYGGKLWKSNVLLRDFVPVRRLSDDAIGLYDYVGRGFFENLLSTTFSYVAKSTPEYIYE